MITKQDILRAVRSVECVLATETDLKAYAAGGCIRDLHYGLPIKDIDILVPVGSTDEQGAFSVMERFALAYLALMGEPVDVTMAYCQSAVDRQTLGDFDERLYGVVKVGSKYGDIDVLFSRYSTIQEVLAWFDCNINQGHMGSDGLVHYQACDELVWIKPVLPSRFERMQSKWCLIQEVKK